MVQAILDAYVRRYPEEAGRVAGLAEFLRGAVEEGAWVSRRNFLGHVTASAFVVDRESGTMLLIHHRGLDRWLQPGGHVEAGEGLVAAAMREVEEEVGIGAGRLELADGDVPLDVDSHWIPENVRKGEPGHFHHDVRYLFWLKGGREGLVLAAGEVKGVRWVGLEELAGGEFGRVVGKVRGVWLNGEWLSG